MAKNLATGPGLTAVESSQSLVNPDRDPVAETAPVRSKRLIDGLYAATLAAIEKWGGQDALARLCEVSKTSINNRVNRREINGVLQHAFLDHLAIACTNEEAASLVMHALSDLLGFEPPKRKRTKTMPEKYEALIKSLRRLGPLGVRALEVAAADLGAHPSEFES